MPKVTVCIPTYNCGNTIKRAMDSALAQDFADFELLVCDNASDDDTHFRVDEYKDPRIRYVRNPQNLGFVGNLSRGLELAKGEYLIYLCADDWWLPGLLRKETDFLDTHPNVGFVHTANLNIEDGKIVWGSKTAAIWPQITTGEDYFKNYFLGSATPMLASVMARRELMLGAGGFDPHITWIPEVAMWLRLSLESDVGYLNEYLVATQPRVGALSRASFACKKTFELPLEMIEVVFAWQKVSKLGLVHLKRLALNLHAKSAIYQFHVIRMMGGSRKDVFDMLWKASCLYPLMLFSLRTWMRLTFALMPNRFIMRVVSMVQTRRRKRGERNGWEG